MGVSAPSRPPRAPRGMPAGRNRSMTTRTLVWVLVLLALAVLAPASPVGAQDSKLELRDGDTIKSILERQAGKRVGMILSSGTVEIGGIVARVTDTAVHLSEITGREFSDAVIRLDHITAVIVRVRGR